MTQMDAIHTTLTDTDLTLRQRLADIGEADLPYLLMAITPGGGALVRGHIDPVTLKLLAVELNSLADAAINRRAEAAY